LSPKLPVIKARQLIKVAKKLGFEIDRQSGSHAIYYRKSDKRRIVVPLHIGKDIKPKTLHGIIRDMNLEIDEFKKLL
jgi:predicted RNA binding protein YcfA (HicA-like mRNA interferase family)